MRVNAIYLWYGVNTVTYNSTFLKKVSIIKNKHLQNAAMKTFYTASLNKNSHQRDLRTKNHADFFKCKWILTIS